MSEIIKMPYGMGKTIGFWRTICLTSYPPQYRYECSNCHSQVKEPGSSCPNCQTEMKSEMEALASEFVKNYSEVQLDVDVNQKIYKSKCRYCGGDLEMFTHRSRSFDGSKVGYATTLFCHGCAGALFDFSESEDDIPNAEKRLLEGYGIKEG